MPVDAALNIYLEHQGYVASRRNRRRGYADYPFDFSMPKLMGVNDLNFYTPRTDVNGPAMTDAIHSIAAAAIDAPGCSAYTYLLRSYQPFLRESYLQFSEFGPVNLTATAYDFLTGVGGFMQEFLYGFSGFRPQVDAVRLDPSLPPQLAGITLSNLQWQGRTFTMHIGPRESSITLNSGAAMPLITPGGAKTAQLDTPLVIPTRRPDLQPTDDLARCKQISVNHRFLDPRLSPLSMEAPRQHGLPQNPQRNSPSFWQLRRPWERSKSPWKPGSFSIRGQSILRRH